MKRRHRRTRSGPTRRTILAGLGTLGLGAVTGGIVLSGNTGSEGAFPTVPAAAPDERGPYPASVRIRSGETVRRIPQTLFGTNVEWIRNANGLWDARSGGLNEGIVEGTRALGVRLVRFPGGSWSDSYDWRNGVGPRAARKATPHSPGDKEQSRHDFGTDEALEFARRTGADLLITANAGTGTPELAADWVRYVNGGGRRRVLWWEIGNELYMKGDNSKSSLPPDRYADRCLHFAAAMRRADPDIRLGAIGLENYGRYRFNDYPGWNETVLRRAGAAIDFLAVHNAYAPVLMAPPGGEPRDVYRALLAAPLGIARNLAATSGQIERFAGPHAERIRIAVTEWGALFAVDPASPWIDHVKTLGSALFVASALKAFIEAPRVDIANFFKLSEHGFMGWLGVRNGAFVPTAPALAFRLAARHLGDRVVPSTTDSPTFDTRTVGVVEAARGVPYLEVLATRDDGASRLAILAINKHFDRPVRAEIVLEGLSGAGRTIVRTLAGRGVDAHTGTRLPPIPGLTWARQASLSADRFEDAAPDSVTLTERAGDGVGARFVHEFPPLSVTVLELEDTR